MNEPTRDDLSAVADKIGKMLRLAEKAGTADEAAAATAKAQAWLEKYNLTLSDVSEETEKGTGAGKRTQEKYAGGFYLYERRLWQAVAELNFCLYFCYDTLEELEKPRVRRDRWGTPRMVYEKRRSHHQVVGRVVNVRATQAMASYLLGTIERLVRERLHGDNTHLLSRWAISFREGAVHAVCEKIRVRRRILLDEERKREAGEAQRMADGHSSSSAVSILTYIDRETDANNDFLHGEGWSAERAARRAARAAEEAQEEAEMARLALEDPEEWARLEAEWRKEERRLSRGGIGSRGGSGGRDPDWSAWKTGSEVGRRIGLDPQAATDERRRLR